MNMYNKYVGEEGITHMYMFSIRICSSSQGCPNSNGITGYEFSHNGYWETGCTFSSYTTTPNECAAACSVDFGCVGFSRDHNYCYVCTFLGNQGSNEGVAYKRCQAR